MKKLRLEIEDLDVQSFSTTRAEPIRRTVVAHAGTEYGFSCDIGESCDTICGTFFCATQAHSCGNFSCVQTCGTWAECGNTCGYTCDSGCADTQGDTCAATDCGAASCWMSCTDYRCPC